MDEQRMQVYLSLIQELLDCSGGEELQILNRHLELVDEGFVQVCEQEAAQLQEAGQDNQAQFLRNVAQQVGQYLNTQTSVVATGEGQVNATEQDYLIFLREVLEATEQSQGNPQVVYPLLQQNLDKLDLTFAEILQDRASQVFAELEPSQTYEIAGVIFLFGSLVQQFPLGNRSEHLEIAIACFQSTLQIYTREAYPYEWAMTQNSLGEVYRNRIQGERLDNQEQSIIYYETALKFYTREAYPYEWAMSQNNLGLAYLSRIRGEPSENLEKAVSCLQAILAVYTREAYPYEWARTQNNLGEAYRIRSGGEQAEDLEQSLACYQATLEVYTPNDFPYEWARTQNNLGLAYSDRIRGNSLENLEQSITCYKAALEVFTRESFPEDWVRTQNNLRLAYWKRIRYLPPVPVVMDEQRMKAYLSLIQELLSCTSGEEADILNRHLELIDAGLVQACELVAAHLQEARQDSQAQFLRNVAQEVGQYLNSKTSGNPTGEGQAQGTEQDYLNFLGCLLRVKLESYNNPQVIYSFLSQNKDKLTLEFAVFLKGWFQSKINVNEANSNEALASLINNLALDIYQFPLGSRANNIEIAIAAYQSVLEIYTREAFPEKWAGFQNNLAVTYLERILGEQTCNLEESISCCKAALEVHTRNAFPEQWAGTQNTLANAYLWRIRGERAKNLEQAILCYKAALEVRTRNAFPEQWADTQNNLANAYCERILGKRAENVEKAIAYYEAALEVHTRNTFPDKWAGIQNNLGIAYNNRIKGERAENLEQAILCYKAALEFHTRETFPEKWADTQNNLGIACCNRIRGERAENLEKAIAYYESAFEVYTRITHPEQWAMTQMNLINAYVNRIRGERAENLERAIICGESALAVYNLNTYPEDWAMTQNNLAIAYGKRIRGERAENLERSIAYSKAALKVRTRHANPYEWATTQMNLGNAYLERIYGEREENIEQAISYYEGALEVRTHKTFPEKWAEMQNNLANAYSKRIQGDRGKNLEQAIFLYQKAMEVRTRNTFPQEHTKTLENLGFAYRLQFHYYSNDPTKKRTALQNTYKVFEQALDAVEYLRGEITSGDKATRKLNEEWNRLYLGMVEVCLELGRSTDAIEYVDRSKARNLTELIATRDAYPGGEISSEVRQRLQELRQEISEEDRRLKQDPNPDYTHISQLREEFQAKYPYKPLNFSEIQSLLDDETVILEWYVLYDKFLTFTLTNQTLNLWTSSEEDRQSLTAWTVSYIEDYIDNNSQWREDLPHRLETLAQILHLDEILHNLRENFPNCQKLILIPHLFLHLLPLHALPIPTEHGKGLLQDFFPKGVAYAPNCQVLKQAQNRQRPHFKRLFAIQNPTQDLKFTDMEVEAIQSLFNSHQVLKHDQAEKAAIDAETLKNAHCTHFSCHGYFNFDEALKSALILAKSEFTPPPPTDDPSRYLPLEDNKLLDLQKCLTLEDILRLDLTNCRLVTLSACETGITDITSTSDEYIGLPSGFILAGSPNVVSTLWAVADISTAIFMIHFYQTLQQQPDLSVVLALQQTQKWLREATVTELVDWIDSCPVISQERQEQIKFTLQWGKKPESQPFSSPYYWAAFCAIGQ